MDHNYGRRDRVLSLANGRVMIKVRGSMKWHGAIVLLVWVFFAGWQATGGVDKLLEFLTSFVTVGTLLGAFILLCPVPKSWQHRTLTKGEESL